MSLPLLAAPYATVREMFNLPPEIIILDVEVTTWEGTWERRWSEPGEYKEVVQIGAIRVETNTLKEKECLSIFIKPIKNPTLSEYFINLTGITQETVDSAGLSPSEAFKKFSDWTGGLPLFSWGKIDKSALEETAKLNNLANFNTWPIQDIREVFKKASIAADQYASSTIVNAFGKTPTRLAHDGLNDARTILDGLRALRERN